MKKTFNSILICCIMALVLAFCLASCNKNCEHVYDDCADVECNLCGDTRDSMHSWEEADCVIPKTCTVCQKTDGEALGHEMTAPDADLCEVQSTCSRCGLTEGQNKEHSYDNACDTACNECNYPRVSAHVYSEYETNLAKHVKKCAGCGVLDESTREEHVYNDEYACNCGYELIVQTCYESYDGRRHVYIYAPNKVLMFTYRYNADGEMDWATEYHYDESGKEKWYANIYYVDGEFDNMSQWISTYDEQGMLIRTDNYSEYSDGSREFLKYQIFTYSDDGTYGKKENYNADGSKTSEDICIYDANGNRTALVCLDSDGKFRSANHYVYDETGLKIKLLVFNDTYYRITDYNEYRRITKHSSYYVDGTTRFQTYTENGDLVFDETNSPDGTKTTHFYEKSIKIKTVVEKDGVVIEENIYN